jgi:hypothetical protein
MDDEERQRTMDFILRQQAQFSAGMQKIEEQQAQFSNSMQKLEEADARADKRLGRLERTMVMLAVQFRRERRDLRERIVALVDAQMRTEEITRQNSEAIRALTGANERNSEDIASLAKVVSDLAQRRNGGDAA